MTYGKLVNCSASLKLNLWHEEMDLDNLLRSLRVQEFSNDIISESFIKHILLCYLYDELLQ